MRKRIILLVMLGVGLSFLPSPTKMIRTTALRQAIVVADTNIQDVQSYYSSLNNNSDGEDLLNLLKTRLSDGHVSFTYANVWETSKITERDWTLSPLSSSELVNYDSSLDNPYVKLLYRERTLPTEYFKANNFHGQRGEGGIEREHIWAKSHGDFGENRPAGTDIHHLLLADGTNNGAHNNFIYANVGPEYKTIGNIDHPNYEQILNNTGKTGSRTHNGLTQKTVYEPQDQDKGDIARALFYMAARYSSYTSAADPYLKLVDSLSNEVNNSSVSSPTTPGLYGLLSDLLLWNKLDPVDDFEIHRNNLIFNNFQKNRNPFIDYPYLADYVWGEKTNFNFANERIVQVGDNFTYDINEDIPVTGVSFSATNLELTVGSSASLDYQVLPVNATNQTVSFSSSNPSIVSVDSSGVVTSLVPGQALITVTTADGAFTDNILVTSRLVEVTGIEVSSGNNLNLLLGQAAQIMARVLPVNATNQELQFISNNPLVASVNQDGLITAIGAGTTTITIRADNGIFSTINVSVTHNHQFEAKEAYIYTHASGNPFNPYQTATTTNIAVVNSTALLSNHQWSLEYLTSNQTAYFGSEATRGMSFGTATNPAKKLTFISDIYLNPNNNASKITAVRVVSGVAGNEVGGVTLTVKIGGQVIGTAPLNGSTAAQTHTFTHNEDIHGKIEIIYDQPLNKRAIYLKEISVENEYNPIGHNVALMARRLDGLDTCNLTLVLPIVNDLNNFSTPEKTHLGTYMVHLDGQYFNAMSLAEILLNRYPSANPASVDPMLSHDYSLIALYGIVSVLVLGCLLLIKKKAH